MGFLGFGKSQKQKELENEITNLTGKIKNDMDYIKMWIHKCLL